jgi:hypothetical protein
VADLMKNAVDQVRAQIGKTGHPGFYSVDKIRGGVDLTPFRAKFAGDDKDLAAAFDDMAVHLVNIIFNGAALR